MNYYNDNTFLSIYNRLNDLVDKCIKEHKDHKYPDGIICYTGYIAEITHKRHDNILRDIDELIKDLNNQGRQTFREVAKFEAVAENQGEINLKHEFRIIEETYKDDKGENRKVYQLSPVTFLVLMGRYNDYIVYCLANFFYRVMKEMEYSLDKLLNTNLDKLDEASELAVLRDSNNPNDRKLFEEYLPKYLTLFGEKENVVELMTGIKTANKSSFCYATSLDVWKITGKTEQHYT